VSRETDIFAKIPYSMPRKKWSAQTEVTPALLKFREKRKWQIALRRYIIDKNACIFYAPYFGLDIENMRKWIETQFEEGLGWDDFGKKWQFDHVIPVTFFDFSDETELKLCWNFTNIRVELFQRNKDRGNRLDVLAAKEYFEELFNSTSYSTCKKLLEKIERIEVSKMVSSQKQQKFIQENRPYLDTIETYSAFEFELLNKGRNLNQVRQELDFLKKFEK
jgi:hypothetical protein